MNMNSCMKTKDGPRPPSIKVKRCKQETPWGKQWKSKGCSRDEEQQQQQQLKGGGGGGGTNALQLHPLQRQTDEGSSSSSSIKDLRGAPSASSTKPFKRIIRRTNLDKSLAAKKRVIRMLFVVVVEFFVCWTPLYVVNTVYLYDHQAVYKILGSSGVALLHLLSYTSSCCNPITYCFMHKKFRQGFLTVFGCRRRRRRRRRKSAVARDVSGNDSSFYFSRQSTLRTEIPCAEKEDEMYRHIRLVQTPTVLQSSM